MIATLADLTMTLGHGSHVRTLLAGPGHGYRHLVHVGVGWGLASLHLHSPRTMIALCPLLRWLAIDGLGFCRQFFRPTQTLGRLRSLPQTPRNQVFVAGVGRALWFTQAADLSCIESDIQVAPQAFQGSMWSGVALASCYAGRAEPVLGLELEAYAGPHTASVRQGLSFAGAALQEHGCRLSAAQTSLLEAFDIDPTTPAQRAARHASDLTTRSGPVANYQAWRARLGQVP